MTQQGQPLQIGSVWSLVGGTELKGLAEVLQGQASEKVLHLPEHGEVVPAIGLAGWKDL
jgi:hypothetical protein